MELDKPDLRMLLFYISAVDKSHACVPDRAYCLKYGFVIVQKHLIGSHSVAVGVIHSA